MITIESKKTPSIKYYEELDDIGKQIVDILRKLLNKYPEIYKEYISGVEVNPSYFFSDCLVWITFKIPPSTTTKHLIKFYYVQGCTEEEVVQDFKKKNFRDDKYTIYINILKKIVAEMKKETALYRLIYKRTIETTLDEALDSKS